MSEKISILIPAYNREKYIAEAVISAQSQTYENVKIFVYDDGSNDRTTSIIKDLCVKDPRIHLIEGKVNKGVSYARNRLLEACDTKYACWLDSDDILNVYRIEIQYKSMRGANHIVFCRASRFRGNLKKKVWQTHPSNLSLKACGVQISSMFLVEGVPEYSEKKILGGEDTYWNRQMTKKFLAVHIPEVLYYIRIHPGRMSSWIRKLKKIPVSDRKGKSYKQLVSMYAKK